MKARTYSRHLALKVLYQIMLVNANADEAFNCTLEIDDEQLPPEAFAFSKELVSGVIEHEQYLDNKLSEYVDKNWDFSRLGSLEIIILRLAGFEILYVSSIPCKVTIDEAIEMAKTYLGIEASRFINGVLHRFTKANDPKGLSDRGKKV